MFYKMVISQWNTDPNDLSLSDIAYERGIKFGKIYREHGILIIGMWTVEGENTNILILGYKDKKHYDEFVEKMQTNKDYQKYSEMFVENRTSVASKTLRMSPMVNVDFDQQLFESYLKSAQSVITNYYGQQ